jgi:hypothetical protein
MKRLLILAALSLLAGVAHAQAATPPPAVSTSVGLNWTAPTANTDASAIIGTLTYNLYQGPKAGPFAKVASGITGTTTIVTSLSAGTCFWLSAVEAITASSTAESVPTGPVCATQPGSPGGLSISVTVKIG